MIKNTIFILAICSFLALNSFGQANNQPLQVEKMQHYRSHAKNLKKIVLAFNDTCQSLYGCSGAKKLRFSKSNLLDSTKTFNVRVDLLIENGDLKKYLELENVILLIDSTKVLVRKETILNTCLTDSLEFIGVLEFEYQYDNFDSCLLRSGYVMSMGFYCNEGEPSAIYDYSHYSDSIGRERHEKRRKGNWLSRWWNSLFSRDD